MRDRIESVLRAWDAIEGHRTATAGDRATVDWLADAVRGLGAVPTAETFAFTHLMPDVARIRWDATVIDGVPCFDAPATPTDGISGRLVPYGEIGDVGLLDFEASGLGEQALIQARHDTTHRALIAINTGSSDAVAVINADAYGAAFGPPVLQVAGAHRAALEDAIATTATVTLTTTLTAEPTTASNIGTTITGTAQHSPPLIVMTPLSGWWHCTSERGGGVIAWLELVRDFTRTPPRRTLHFTANTGHELGHVGLDHYLSERPGCIADAACWLHLGANFAARNGPLILQTSHDDLRQIGHDQFDEVEQTIDLTVGPETRPFGEARNIYDGGGRYVSVLGGNPLFHHPDDRWPHAVDVAKTERVCRALVAIARQLAT